MERLWTEEEAQWLAANMDRMDALSLARSLKIPVAAVEAKVREQRLARAEAAAHRSPATVREAERERSAARKAYEHGMELLHQKELEKAAACFTEVIERHPDERELADRARIYLKLARGGLNGGGRPPGANEIYHEAVFQKNRGNVRGALDLLGSLDGAPDADGPLPLPLGLLPRPDGRPAGCPRKPACRDGDLAAEPDPGAARGRPRLAPQRARSSRLGRAAPRDGGPRLAVVVLAAGRGVRMRSALPKVLHHAGGRPLLDRPLAAARDSPGRGGGGPLVVVVGAGREAVVAHLAADFPGGGPRRPGPAARDGRRGHASRSARRRRAAGRRPRGGRPAPAGLRRWRGSARRSPQRAANAVAVLTAVVPDAGSYGRVVRGTDGAVLRIVEAKDATPEERAVREINSGIYAFDRAFLDRRPPAPDERQRAGRVLPDRRPRASRSAPGRRVVAVPVDDAAEVLGVNSRAELAEVDARLRRRAAERGDGGGRDAGPPRDDHPRRDGRLEPDSVVEPFATLIGGDAGRERDADRPGVRRSPTRAIGRNVTVRPYCVVEKARRRRRRGRRAVRAPAGGDGPRRGRPRRELRRDEEGAPRAGRQGEPPHLPRRRRRSARGRTSAPGVITCNYDGYAKHRTEIGAGRLRRLRRPARRARDASATAR